MRSKTADLLSTRRISILALLALAGGMLVIAGCGSSNKSSTESTAAAAPATPSTESTAAAPTTTTGALSLAADSEGQLKYDTTSLSAKAGQVSIDFTNSSPLSHNMTVASSSGAVVAATPTFQGGSKKLTLNLKPGTYKFYCSVPGHRAAGMEGTLTVK